MRRTVQSIALATLLAVGTLACFDSPTQPPDAVEPPCETAPALSVTVTAGSPPVFDWSPACGVTMLLVEPPDTAQERGDRWAIWIDPEPGTPLDSVDLILPPVTYGVAPAEAGFENEAVSLTPGREYELILWRPLPEGASVSGCDDVLGAGCMTLHPFFP